MKILSKVSFYLSDALLLYKTSKHFLVNQLEMYFEVTRNFWLEDEAVTGEGEKTLMKIRKHPSLVVSLPGGVCEDV